MIPNYDEWKLEASPLGKDEPQSEYKFLVSNCCGAEPKSNGDTDTKEIGICPICKEHPCEYVYEDER